MFTAIVIAGLVVSAIIVIVVQWASVARARLVCQTDVEIARIAAGRTTTLDIRVDRASKHHVSAELSDAAKAIEQTGRLARRALESGTGAPR